MARSVFRQLKITGIAGAVPSQRQDNLLGHEFCPADERQKIVALTGIREYRKAAPNLCTSDLCAAAASSLISGLRIDPRSIDGIIFASMTGDFRAPSTACLLQDRLGCSTSTVAFDINMGCSGFVVGLFAACSLLQGAGLKRILLLAGDTQSKLCHEQDKTVVFLMGDAGTATLLEFDEQSEDVGIELITDGSRFRALYVPAGGCRNPSTDYTRTVRERSDGGVRSDEHLYMDGMEIFRFSATDVVESLKHYMKVRELTPEKVDFLVLHQANKFMTDKIARKAGFPKEKVPYSLEVYGNTGAASIPLTINHHYGNMIPTDRNRLLLSGFGVGLSWGFVDITLDHVYCPPIVEC